MKRETLIEMLRSDCVPLTPDEVIEIMEKELDKAPEDADTDLIDLCIEILKEEAGEIPEKAAPDIDTLNRKMAEMLASEENENQIAQENAPEKHRRIKFGKIFALVAVVAVLAAVITTVSADYFNIDAPEDIVRFVKDRFITNLSDDDSVDLLLAFEEHGLENIVLPEVFYNQELYKITEFECEKVNLDDYRITFNIQMQDRDINGYVTITNREHDNVFNNGKQSVYGDYKNIKEFNFGDSRGLVFSSVNNDSFITYKVKNTEYFITFINCGFREAVAIADAIK